VSALLLSRYEVRIIAELALGRRTRHIAAQLGLTDAALKSRITYTARRLNIRGLKHPQLVHHASGHGYLAVPTPPDNPLCLPLREAQSLTALTRGLSVAQTAAELGIAYDTANMQRRTLYRRLDAHTGAHAVALGWQLGLLGGPT
jgi:DNA-binding CsgD family transcriptional regulator